MRDREYCMAFHLCGRGEEGRHVVCIKTVDGLQHGVVIGCVAQGNNIGACGTKTFLNAIQINREALYHFLGVGQLPVDAPEKPVRLPNQSLLAVEGGR